MKEQPLLYLKDTNKEGDRVWTTMASNDSVSDIIRVETSDGNSEDNLRRISDDVTLGLSNNTMIGVDDSYKLGE